MLQKIRGLKFKSILSGFLVDTLGTLAISAVLVTTLAARGFSEAEIAARLHSLSGLFLMLIFGLGFTILGGYVAGRAAKQEELLHGAAVAGIGLVLGLFLRDPGLPLWYEALSYAAMVPAGAVGGYFAKEANAKKNLPGAS